MAIAVDNKVGAMQVAGLQQGAGRHEEPGGAPVQPPSRAQERLRGTPLLLAGQCARTRDRIDRVFGGKGGGSREVIKCKIVACKPPECHILR